VYKSQLESQLYRKKKCEKTVKTNGRRLYEPED